MNWIKLILLQVLATFLLFEVCSFIGTKFELFYVNETPKIYLRNHARDVEARDVRDIYEIRTENMSWGAWRLPNQVAGHRSSCFDVEVSSNEVGARDASFKNNVESDVVLLGDSFAEGIGVEYEQTAQYLIETKLGINLLNFGTAGNFGPLQELIIYKELASEYLHQQVIIFVLPANDFKDNERTYWNDSAQKRMRYRPYYESQGDPVVPWYFPESKKSGQRDSSNDLTKTQKAVNFFAHVEKALVDFTWTSNALRTLHRALFRLDHTVNSYYTSATTSEQEHMVAAYDGIVEAAAGRPVSFVIIPAQRDITTLDREAKATLPLQLWYQGLTDLAIKSGGVFIDLIDFVPEKSSLLFHSCDGHWSEAGNIWAATLVAEAIKKEALR
ncbi:hypothetical protein OAT86_00455 [Planktomarina sp.]|nr:hypothetical protein [Planktomarina temperata]MDC3221718.1 hypothetical protein [Planktomarina sp.]